MGWKPARIGPRRAGKRPLADGETAAKLRALWISGYHLGVVQDPAEAALAAFVKRVTGGRRRGVEALQWLTNADASKAIEALKAWLGRAAGVEWATTYSESGRFLRDPRRDVVVAQWQILSASTPEVPSFATWLGQAGFPPILSLYEAADWDRLIARLGDAIRARTA